MSFSFDLISANDLKRSAHWPDVFLLVDRDLAQNRDQLEQLAVFPVAAVPDSNIDAVVFPSLALVVVFELVVRKNAQVIDNDRLFDIAPELTHVPDHLEVLPVHKGVTVLAVEAV